MIRNKTFGFFVIFISGGWIVLAAHKTLNDRDGYPKDVLYLENSINYEAVLST
jgi:hypothetical protein